MSYFRRDNWNINPTIPPTHKLRGVCSTNEAIRMNRYLFVACLSRLCRQEDLYNTRLVHAGEGIHHTEYNLFKGPLAVDRLSFGEKTMHLKFYARGLEEYLLGEITEY